MKQHGLKATAHVHQPEEYVWTIPTIAALGNTLENVIVVFLMMRTKLFQYALNL